MSEIVTEKSSIPFDAAKENIVTENKSSANTTSIPEKGTYTCSVCGCIHPLTELTEVEGDYYCPDCFERETVTCSHCGCRILLDDMVGSDDFPLCQGCYDDHYTGCSCCGRIIHQDDAYYENENSYEAYCSSCYRTHSHNGSIEDYYYKPNPIFYGNGTRYFGVELEVDGAGECDDNAEDVMSIGNRKADHIYCKHDGSLDDGFEIVTHPMTLDYHIHNMPWAAVLDSSNNLYIVKGNNPMCLYHYPKAGVYIYASTEEILLSALKKLSLNLGEPDKISIGCGKIMRINSSGKRTIEEFNADNLLFDYSLCPYCFGYSVIPHSVSSKTISLNIDELTYINELKTVARYFGYTDDYIDFLLSEGYSIDDIEEVLYCI